MRTWIGEDAQARPARQVWPDVVLAGVGLVAILAYGLSCRPAWRPDGTGIAFPYRDGERSGIALYEVGGGPARRLVEEAGDDLAGAQCLWPRDGRSLLCLRSVEKNGLRLVRLDLTKAGAAGEKVLDIAGLDDPVLAYPPTLVEDRYLWVSGLKQKQGQLQVCLRIDLAERRSETFFADVDLETYIIDGGPRGVFYLRGQEHAEQKVGRLDSKAGRLAPPFLTLPARESMSFPCPEPGGQRLAWVDAGGAAPTLRLFDEQGRTLETIPLPSRIEDVWFSTWTPGGLIWLSAERKLADGGKEPGLVHVRLSDKRVGFISLGQRPKDAKDAEDVVPLLEPALSPDGQRLAVAASALPAVDGVVAGLLIFDAAIPADPPQRVLLAPR